LTLRILATWLSSSIPDLKSRLELRSPKVPIATSPTKTHGTLAKFSVPFQKHKTLDFLLQRFPALRQGTSTYTPANPDF
jgi:hypothetical protein